MTPPRRRGRPSLPAREALGDPIVVRLPLELHDRACRAAIREGTTVSEVVRIALRRMFRDAPKILPL